MARRRKPDPLIQAHPSERNILRGAIHRCHNPKSPAFKDYGGRGIIVADRYRHGENGMSGFACFISDIGPRPTDKHSLDRIDVNRGYEPRNLRWATQKQQMRNTRRTIYVDVAGARIPAADAVEMGGEAAAVGKRVYVEKNAGKQSAFRARKKESGTGVHMTTMAHPSTVAGIKTLADKLGITQYEALRKAVTSASEDETFIVVIAPKKPSRRTPSVPGQPTTNAQRQAAYRARKAASGDGARLTQMVHPSVPELINRMASRHGATHADVLRSVVERAEQLALGASQSQRVHEATQVA